MTVDVADVQNDEANADQVTPEKGIDFDSAAEEAERRLEGEVPVETPAEPEAAQPEVKTEEPEEEPEKAEAADEQAPDEPKEEPDDHKDRTKLGRKVAKLEDNIGRLLEQNAMLIERLSAPQAPPQVDPEQESEEYIDLSTPEGLDQFLAKRERDRMTAAERDKAQYGGGYAGAVREWNTQATDSEDADAPEIHKLLTGDTPFNVRRSHDPKADFQYNLSKAEAHYYKQKAKTPAPARKPPLQNSAPRAPLAVGGESKVDAGGGNSKPLKISEAAMEFAKAQGWSNEEVAKTLSAPVPNSFVRGRR